MADYFHRNIEPALKSALKQFPAAIITGPRQSGKTSLVKKLLAGSHGYVSLETPDVRAFAARDPRGFLERNGPPVIIDEIQYAPGILNHIKEIIDSDRDAVGQFVLTGSRNFLLMQGVSQSLAGRTAILELFPLALSENPAVYYWRTTANEEVDFIIEHGGKFHALECKFTATPSPSHFRRGLEAFSREIPPAKQGIKAIIYPCGESLAGSLSSGRIRILSLGRLAGSKTIGTLLAR